jgi:hypothetical protein
MLINKDWDFETAIGEISKKYYPGGITTGPLRNRLVEAWGQLAGKTRALSEYDDAIKRYGSLSAFCRAYRVSMHILRGFRELFENLPDDQIADSKVGKITKVFISYSWDNENHIKWVRDLATRLRSDGIDVTLDQWHLVPGDQLPEFMERSVSESDYVLIICTHKYRVRSINRQGGVGYEGDIITAEFMTTRKHRKFIPILRQQTWKDSAPNWLLGKKYIDFSSSPYPQTSYDELFATLSGTREKAPPIGTVKKQEPITAVSFDNTKIQPLPDFEPIQIIGIIDNQVGTPRNDGTPGSALYKIPFRLSHRPPREWIEIFLHLWDNPPRYTTMHRPGIASVFSDTIALDGTTMGEVRDYHKDTLIFCVQEANKAYIEFHNRQKQADERKQEQIRENKQNVDNVSRQIYFDDK